MLKKHLCAGRRSVQEGVAWLKEGCGSGLRRAPEETRSPNAGNLFLSLNFEQNCAWHCRMFRLQFRETWLTTCPTVLMAEDAICRRLAQSVSAGALHLPTTGSGGSAPRQRSTGHAADCIMFIDMTDILRCPVHDLRDDFIHRTKEEGEPSMSNIAISPKISR